MTPTAGSLIVQFHNFMKKQAGRGKRRSPAGNCVAGKRLYIFQRPVDAFLASRQF